MATNLRVNDQFPDFSLPDQQNEMVTLSHFTRHAIFNRKGKRRASDVVQDMFFHAQNHQDRSPGLLILLLIS